MPPMGLTILIGATLAMLASAPLLLAQAPETTAPPPAGQELKERQLRLFDAAGRELAAAVARSGVQAPRIVCGMRIFPADPAIDPGIRRPLPASDTEYTLRRVPPPACTSR